MNFTTFRGKWGKSPILRPTTVLLIQKNQNFLIFQFLQNDFSVISSFFIKKSDFPRKSEKIAPRRQMHSSSKNNQDFLVEFHDFQQFQKKWEISLKIRNFTKNAKFSKNGDFLTFCDYHRNLTPLEGENPRHRVKVTALGEEMEEFHLISLKITILVNKAEMT